MKGKKAGGHQSIKTELQALKKKLGKSKRKIAALKVKAAEEKHKNKYVNALVDYVEARKTNY